jgi:hypothetical protein
MTGGCISRRQTAKRPFTGQNALYHPDGKMYFKIHSLPLIYFPKLFS